ncbi:RNA polymerase sigma factor [Nannocystaceae bacterium ST9]
MIEDAELLRRWREGDRRAGNELFQRHFEAVRRFFINKVDDEVEELVQRTFMACIEGKDRFEGRSEFRGYLLGIARHLMWKHWEVRRNNRNEPIDECSIYEMGAGPSTMLGRRDEERRLLDALRRIPLESQVVLELYYWESMTGSQMAIVLDMPENTVRTAIRRAKAALGVEMRRMERFAGKPESTDTDLDAWAAGVRAGLEGG